MKPEEKRQELIARVKQAIKIIETKAWADDASLTDLEKLGSSPYLALKTALKLLENQGVQNEN